jgi:tripeptidyl-peptidase-1
MQIRKLLVGLSSLGNFALSPVSGERVYSRDRPSRGTPSSHTIHERHERRHLEGWVKRELVDAEAAIPVRIGLTQANTDAGHDLLMEM